MKELRFPLLTKDQIEVRVGQVSEYGYTLLLYKTSRTDAEILDQVVGIGNWQKRFYTLQGVGVGETVRSIVVCSVGIYDDDKKEWIWKDDSGTEGNIEQDKSICSDAFKRASGGSCWGIGRELYYTGRIYVKGGTQKKTYGNGYELADKFARFEVKEISWNEKPLSLKKLVIVDENNNVVFSYPKTTNYSQNAQKDTQNTKPYGKGTVEEITKGLGDTFVVDDDGVMCSAETKEKIQEITGHYDADKYNRFKKYMQDNFGCSSIAELTESQGQQLLKVLGGK